MSSGVLVVFAKSPDPGRVKTRMAPPLTLEQAAGLYAALLGDVLEASARIAARLDLEPVLAVYPPEARRALARGAPPGFRVVSQRGRDLAGRMDWAVREWAAAGAQRILLRGSDSPLLDGDHVAQVLEALDEVELSLCPDRDGGYSLIGLRGAFPGIFAHEMSTRSVMQHTIANARALGLRARTLSPCFDLDRVEDLGQLASLRSQQVTELCPRTLAYLDEQQLWRFAGRH